MELAIAIAFGWLVMLTLCFVLECLDTAKLREWTEATRDLLDKRLTAAEDDIDTIRDNGRRLLKKARKIWED